MLRLPSLREGSVFAGRYRVSGWLGSGGAGEVFSARDEVTGEEVALKVLYPRADLEAALARLRREVRVLRPLRHPGVVRLHDVGQSEGLLYLVMERLYGRTLGQRLSEEGALPGEEVEELARGLLSALAAAHEAGVIHRDIKPGNIFLCEVPDAESAGTVAGRDTAGAGTASDSSRHGLAGGTSRRDSSGSSSGSRSAGGSFRDGSVGGSSRGGAAADSSRGGAVGDSPRGGPAGESSRGGSSRDHAAAGPARSDSAGDSLRGGAIGDSSGIGPAGDSPRGGAGGGSSRDAGKVRPSRGGAAAASGGAAPRAAGAGARIAAGGAPAPGSAFRVVLLDFGLARGLEDARLTMTGQFAGTPEYVSPEQAEGRSELTAATDLFSAGLVLCRALSDGPLAGGDSLSSQLAARRRGVPPRAREALGRATPRLARLIPWLLEREPRERPGDAGVALALLEGRRRRAPAWLRALRRRRVAVSLLAALLLAAAAAFVPLRIELQDGQPRRRSLLGVDLGGWDLPRQVDLPRLDPGSFGPGRWLVALPNGRMPHDRECMPEGYPSGLGVIRPWSRRIEPFVLWLSKGGMGERRIPRHGFAGYDQVFTPPSQVTAVPWPGEDGKRLFVAAYSHSLLMPGQIAVFDAEGNVTALLDNPGRIGVDPLRRHSGLILLPPEPGERGAGLLVFLAGNLELGNREVYGAIRLSSIGSTLLQFPGVDLGGHSVAAIRYYLALGYQATRGGARLEKAGAALRIVDEEGRLLRRFDPRTGIPIDAADRGGLDEQSWLDRVLELRRIFRRAAPGVSFPLDPEEGAALLEKFATDRAATASQRGLALGRAAELSIEAGEFRHAAALARRALMQEPDHYHHARLLFQALTRSVGWRAARAAVIAASPTEEGVTVNDRDLAVAVAASGTAAEARALVSEFEHETIARAYYPTYCAMLLRLHLGEPTAALSALLATDGPLLDLPELVFLQALALALEGPPRAAEARALLDGHETGFGSGNPVPTVPLAALLAEWGAGEGPSPPEIEIAVRRQHEAGRTNLLSWVFVPWAEALAARAALERGDEEAFTRHAAAARSAPGGGPWLELLLPQATGESRR